MYVHVILSMVSNRIFCLGGVRINHAKLLCGGGGGGGGGVGVCTPGKCRPSEVASGDSGGFWGPRRLVAKMLSPLLCAFIQ